MTNISTTATRQKFTAVFNNDGWPDIICVEESIAEQPMYTESPTAMAALRRIEVLKAELTTDNAEWAAFMALGERQPPYEECPAAYLASKKEAV